jgi:glucose-6-phosphate 1-dehydrogenase
MTNPGEDRPGDPCTIVIFGSAGDLTKRKLIPALYNLRLHGLLPKDFAVVGVARRDMSHEVFREQTTKEIHQFATTKVDDAIWAEFRNRLYFCPGEFPDPATYKRLGEILETAAKSHNTGGNVLFYLSTPPEFFAEIVQQIGNAKLAEESDHVWKRVIIEKPFGRDLDSATELNEKIRCVLRERQIYRIDHYLGKETVQNIMAFRFANGIFEPVWNRRYIDHVQITVGETLGVEGRGGYYETSGVLRDMIQNHMFQLMALIAMEPPISFEADRVRDERVKVLQAIKPMQPEEILHNTVRGQYGEGTMDGHRVPAYRSEAKVNPNSATETYAALRLHVENWRWANVPFYLRSGKRVAKRDTEIVIQFRKPPMLLFPRETAETIDPNRLILHIQPEEAIEFQIKAKKPGPAQHLTNVRLDFSYSDLGEKVPTTGYERLIYDAMVGDSTLFHRSDMVEAAWRIATPILDVWASLTPRDFPNYASGSWGPVAADQLLAREGRQWHNPPGAAAAGAKASH